LIYKERHGTTRSEEVSVLDQTSPNRNDSVQRVRRLAPLTTHRILALVFILAWYAIGVRWIWLYRHGNLFDWDEANYLSIAASAARTHELGRWLGEIVFGNDQAPATPGIAAAIFSLFGIHPFLGLLVPLSAAALTLMLIFSIGLRVGGPWMAWIALVLVATMPIFVNYSRSFNFAMVSTLATMAALYCLLRSAGMGSLRWALLFGFCVGLLPLTRTMALAYVPALVLAALISSLGRENSPQRIGRLAGATILATATTAVWLVPNWGGVWGYLLDYGYGQHSTEIYAENSVVHWGGAWIETMRYYAESAHVIHSAILIAGVTLAAVFAVRQSRGIRPAQILRKVAHSGLLGPSVLFAVGTIALASTPNHGTGFDLPLLAALTLVSAWGLTRAHTYTYLQRSGVFAIILAVLIVYIPYVDLRWPTAEPRSIRVDHINAVITDGRGTLQLWEQYYSGNPFAVPRPEPIDTATTREWQQRIIETAEFIRHENQASAPVALGFNHSLYNDSSVELAALSKYDYRIRFETFDLTVAAESEDAYFDWLTNGSARGSCLLFTSAGIANEIPPVTDSETLSSAARRANFRSFAGWKLPDGRNVVAWHRESDLCRKN
jgi:4-amino-4-deoxy-L-arabinose transferase-like glycosyltransferase